MNKTKKSIGLYLTLVAGIIAIVEAIYYGQVMYTLISQYITSWQQQSSLRYFPLYWLVSIK